MLFLVFMLGPDRYALDARCVVEVLPLLNDYPQGHPTMLTYSLLGRRLRPGVRTTPSGGESRHSRGDAAAATD